VRYPELSQPDHPAKRERPSAIARLVLAPLQWGELRTVLDQHGETEIIGATPIGFGISIAEVRCRDVSMAEKLSEAWLAHVQVSPSRPCL
jgi:hypothetical protein